MPEGFNKKLISLDLHKARQIVLAEITELHSEMSSVINSFGRVAAEHIIAKNNYPESDVSLVDGYAVISDDLNNASDSEPVYLSIFSESSINTPENLHNRTATKISTGSHLPQNADAVLCKNDFYKPETGLQLIVKKHIKKLYNVCLAGSYIKSGENLVDKGFIIGTSEMKIIAETGIRGIKVIRKPQINVITLGSNLVEISEHTGKGQRKNSLRYEIAGCVFECGCEISELGHSTGRPGLEKCIESSKKCDALIIGISKEDSYDIALTALRNEGKVFFERVHFVPGGAFAFGKTDKCYVFVIQEDAVKETFEAIIRPAMLTLRGIQDINRPMIRAIIDQTIKLNSASSYYIKAVTRFDGNTSNSYPLQPYSSKYPLYTSANSMIVVPQGTSIIKRGEIVDVILLDQTFT